MTAEFSGVVRSLAVAAGEPVFEGEVLIFIEPAAVEGGVYSRDAVVDPDFDGFRQNVERLGEMHGEDCTRWPGYLRALRNARQRFQQLGCTATDHGHPTASTADLDSTAAAALFARVIAGHANVDEHELFRAQMLTEMARMSLEDGLVMQIHPGSRRNHNRQVFTRFGRDVGADIPMPTEYVHALQPLLERFGNDASLTIILFTLDESTYSRELAPLAGHYPCLRLGPPWWFYDSPEGMRRFYNPPSRPGKFNGPHE